MFGGGLGALASQFGQASYSQYYKDALAQQQAASYTHQEYSQGFTVAYGGTTQPKSYYFGEKIRLPKNYLTSGTPKSFREELQKETDAWLGMLW